MEVSVGPYTFENVSYDAEADVLYLHVGEPSAAVAGAPFILLSMTQCVRLRAARIALRSGPT